MGQKRRKLDSSMLVLLGKQKVNVGDTGTHRNEGEMRGQQGAHVHIQATPASTPQPLLT